MITILSRRLRGPASSADRAVARGARESQRDGSSDSWLASLERVEPTPRDDTWNWPDHCQRNRRDSDRRVAFQIRPTIGGVDRPGAAAELIRRQRSPRQDQQAGRSLSPSPSRGRCPCRTPLQPNRKSAINSLGGRSSDEEAIQRRRSRPGEQNGAGRLGANDVRLRPPFDAVEKDAEIGER